MRYAPLFMLLAKIALIATGLAFSASAHAQDYRWKFPQQYSVSPKGVNLQTGRFMHQATDVSIGDLKFDRSFGDLPAFVPEGARSLGLVVVFGRKPNGWTHNFNEGVTTAGGAYKLVVGSVEYQFKTLLGGEVVPSDKTSQGTDLDTTGGVWTFRDKSGNRFEFLTHPAVTATGGSARVLSRAIFADGRTVDYSYNANGQPSFVRSGKGYAIAITYDPNKNVAQVCGYNLALVYADASTGCGPSVLRSSYQYNATGHLTTVTDTGGDVVTMTYSSLGQASGAVLPSCISLPNAATCEIQNVFFNPATDPCCAAPDQVRRQTTAQGLVWQYLHEPPPNPNDEPVVPGQPRYHDAEMTDPEAGNTLGRYDRGRLTLLASPSGETAYKYVYLRFAEPSGPPGSFFEYHDSAPSLITYPEGNREFFRRDDRGNILMHSHWPKGAPIPANIVPSDPAQADCCIKPDVPVLPPGSVTYYQSFLPSYGLIGTSGNVYTLGCGVVSADARLCDKPVWRKDARGNQTDYTYDAAHGGVLTETGPTVGGVRPQTRFSYIQRQAWVKTAGGSYVQTGAPIWLLASKSVCKTGAPSGAGCAIAGDEVRTTYDYGPDAGPNNLELRGMVEDATGAQLRTCYAYDAQGNKISETRPRAGLTSCS